MIKREEPVGEKEGAILIVDDEPDMCWALENILRENGMLSKRALSAREALESMESHCFLLAVLDAKLPDMEGLELAKRIRELDPDIPILMISGYFYRGDEEVQKTLAEGLICSFISKPFLHEEMKNAIASALSLRPSQSTLPR